MAKYLICAVMDEAVSTFSAPMIFRSKLEAIRTFSDIASDVNSQYNKHPSDFVLYHVGVYDDTSAICDSISPLVRIISAAEATVVSG